MASTDSKSVLVRMPPELKRGLAHEVARRQATLNDVAVGILASRFDVPFTPSGRKGSAPGESGVVLLRMPAGLKSALKAAADEQGTTTNRVIVHALAKQLGTELRPPRRTRMAQTNGTRNGSGRRSDDKVRVAIIGVGNCANALLQGA